MDEVETIKRECLNFGQGMKIMDIYKSVKLHCLESARNSWQARYFFPYVIGFKNSESFMMLMPRFISNRKMINQFMDTVSSEEKWDAMALLNHTDDGNITIVLILPEVVLVAKAEISNDFGGQSLSEFSDWQVINDETIDFSDCLSRNEGDDNQKRIKDYG